MRAMGAVLAFLVAVIIGLHSPQVAAQGCAVISADTKGVPVRIKCGELQLYAQTPAQAADCRLWRSKAQTAEGTLQALRRCQLHAQDLLEARDGLYAQLRAQDDLLSRWEAEADSRWTTLEVVGLSGIGIGAGLVVGVLVGLFAF